MRLRTTLVGLLVVLGIVLSSTVYAGFALHKDDIVATERAEVNETAATVAHNLGSRVDAKTQIVRVGTEADALAAHGSERQASALDSFVGRTTFHGASVVAANGTVMAFTARGTNATERERVLGSNLGDREYVRTALDGRSYVSDPVRADSGNYVVVVSAPVRDETGVVGTLNAAFHLEPPAADRQTLFADLSHLVGPTQSVTVRHGDETLYRSERIDGETLHATEPVPSTDWTVVVEQDRTAIASQLRDVTLVQSGALLVVLCCIGTVGYWTYRTNLQQIAALREGLVSLEDGEYDVDLELSGTDEWDEIGGRFERVGTRLAQRETQLGVLNRVLRHNLRNEMNVVLGHSQSLRKDDADVEAHASAIESAVRETLDISQHARMLEDRLKDATETHEPGTLSAVVEDAMAAVDETTLATVTVDVDADATVADADAVRTALEEVLANAIVHNPLSPVEREVSVSASAAGSTATVTVADNGPGLPHVERALLAGELEASPVEHGEGLGLWIARWLVERADGSLHATVDEDGTVVEIVVPTTGVGD